MGPFYSLLVAIYKHAKLRAPPPQPVSQMLEFHLSHNLVGAQFSCLQRGKKCSCDNVKQCVLTIQLSTVGNVMQKEQPARGSANIL